MRESATSRVANPVGEPTPPYLHHCAKVRTFDSGLEFWDFSTDEFVKEAGEHMCCGGVGRHTDISQGGWYVSPGFSMYGGAR